MPVSVSVRFVNEGPERFAASDAVGRLRSELEQTIAAEYAEQRDAAGFWRRLWIAFQMRRELRRRWQAIGPSPQRLWLTEYLRDAS
jgi:hypothetical protein